jgi:muramidase (phage lysozyme)
MNDLELRQEPRWREPDNILPETPSSMLAEYMGLKDDLSRSIPDWNGGFTGCDLSRFGEDVVARQTRLEEIAPLVAAVLQLQPVRHKLGVEHSFRHRIRDGFELTITALLPMSMQDETYADAVLSHIKPDKVGSRMVRLDRGYRMTALPESIAAAIKEIDELPEVRSLFDSEQLRRPIVAAVAVGVLATGLTSAASNQFNVETNVQERSSITQEVPAKTSVVSVLPTEAVTLRELATSQGVSVSDVIESNPEAAGMSPSDLIAGKIVIPNTRTGVNLNTPDAPGVNKVSAAATLPSSDAAKATVYETINPLVALSGSDTMVQPAELPVQQTQVSGLSVADRSATEIVPIAPAQDQAAVPAVPVDAVLEQPQPPLQAETPDTIPTIPEDVVTTQEVTPEAPPPPPITPESLFHQDITAVGQALEHAYANGGDLGPLNHLVVNSPLFEPHGLDPSLRHGSVIRELPPSNLFELPGLRYEFSPDTPSDERRASSQTIALTLYSSYALNKFISANPVWQQQYTNACIRVGDFAAEKGHKSHSGTHIDLTSSLDCNVIGGTQSADGPVFWINKSTGNSSKVENKSYDKELDRLMIESLMQAHIDEVPVLQKVFYNARIGEWERLKPLENHSNHIHVETTGINDPDLKHASDGGVFPEENLDETRRRIFAAYELAIQPPEVESPPSESNPSTDVTPQKVYDFAMELLLGEIAKGEGGWDSVNTGHAGDTQIGSDRYNRIFGGRMLSQISIQEVLDLQKRDKLFAVGRFQIIPDNLTSAIQATGIDTSRLFDEQSQRELAVNYLIMQKRQNLAGFITGELPESAINSAINDLCKEWASLPCTDGSGYYDGDSAGNNARKGKYVVNDIKTILLALRNSHQQLRQIILDSANNQGEQSNV